MKNNALNAGFGLCLFAASAWGQVSVKVADVDPPPPAVLGNQQRVSLRIACQSESAVRVRAEPSFRGRAVPGMTSGMPPCGPGAGEALYWFAYTDPAQVDKIVVTAQEGLSGRVLASVELPANLRWTGGPAAAREEPAWVAQLQEAQNRRMRAEAEAFSHRPGAWKDTVLGLAVVWCLPAYFVLQLVLLSRWSGGWRLAAAAPLLPMAAALAHAVYAARAGSNIFPLVLIFMSVPSLAYLVVLAAVKSRAA